MAEAHSELFSLLSGIDVLSAAEHTRRAVALASELGYRLRLPAGQAVLPPADDVVQELATEPAAVSFRPRLSAVRAEIPIAPVVADVLAQAAEAVGGAKVDEQIPSELAALIAPANLQSILTNLLLTARDAIPTATRIQVDGFHDVVGQGRAAEFAGGAAGTFLVLRVRASGTGVITSTYGGLSGCRLAVSKVDGFWWSSHTDGPGFLWRHTSRALQSRNRLIAPPSGRRAAVYHSDRLTRRTVVAALSQLGLETIDLDSSDGENDLGSALVFGAADDLESLSARTTGRVVELVTRGASPQWPGPTLQVPFEMGDLEAFVGRDDGRRRALDGRLGAFFAEFH